MRMRRKTNLDDRMEICREYLPIRVFAPSDARISAQSADYSLFSAAFSHDYPVDLEIGCGKGGYTVERAQKFPNRNLIGVERISNVLVMAAEKAMDAKLENVRFFNVAAEYLPHYLPNGSISTVIVNFPTPLPNTPAEKQRLTSPRFLELYRSMLVDNGYIEFKTDKEWFFDYTAEKLIECGFDIEFKTRDLHSEVVDNIMN